MRNLLTLKKLNTTFLNDFFNGISNIFSSSIDLYVPKNDNNYINDILNIKGDWENVGSTICKTASKFANISSYSRV